MAIKKYGPTTPGRRGMTVTDYSVLSKVAKVNTISVRGRFRRQGMHAGYTAASKKAIVTLTKDSKEIEFFNSMV